MTPVDVNQGLFLTREEHQVLWKERWERESHPGFSHSFRSSWRLSYCKETCTLKETFRVTCSMKKVTTTWSTGEDKSSVQTSGPAARPCQTLSVGGGGRIGAGGERRWRRSGRGS
jgi:hypothetical protein